MFFKVTKVSDHAFPDDAWVEQALALFGLTQDEVVEAVRGFQSSTALRQDTGHQQILAQELERHLGSVLQARGLIAGREQYSPRLGERPDLALSKDGRAPQLYVEIEFRPNVEKDLVKFQIGANTGLLGLAVLVLAESRDDINPAYTTMPEFGKYRELIRELKPSYPLLLLGLRGHYVEEGEQPEPPPKGGTSRSGTPPAPDTSVPLEGEPAKEPQRQQQITGRSLNREWKVGASQALYHRDGAWYHRLERFPGAFFDPNGYVLFRTREEYERSPYLSIGKHVNVRSGISSMPAYVRIRRETAT